jgi:hypothetical protein
LFAPLNVFPESGGDSRRFGFMSAERLRFLNQAIVDYDPSWHNLCVSCHAFMGAITAF